MKQCSYCGKEYPDGTTVCLIDRQPLDHLGSNAEPEVGAATLLEPPPSKNDAHLVYPEYQWSARDVWKFVGMMLVINLLFGVVFAVLYFVGMQFPRFYGLRSFLTLLALNSTYILTAAYFARTDSFNSFWKAMGLDRKPTNYVWFGVAAALAIRLGGHVLYIQQSAKQHDAFDSFPHKPGLEEYFSLLPLLLAPFLEEPVFRGFLYTGLRRSYSIGISTALVVGFTAWTHWYQYSYLGVAAIMLSAWTVVQCFLREKSDSLWDCILCHLVFNASSILVNHLLR